MSFATCMGHCVSSPLLPADVEKLLYQSFPVHELDLRALKRRDFCLHLAVLHSIPVLHSIWISSQGTRGPCWQLYEHPCSGSSMDCSLLSDGPSEMEL